MPTYKRFQLADAPMITDFWNTHAVPLLINNGYYGQTITLERWQQNLSNPRKRYYGALLDNGNMAGLVEGIISKTIDKHVSIGRFAVRAGISLAQIRNHRDQFMPLLLNEIPNNWTVSCYGVRNILVAREWLDARWGGQWEDDGEERNYLIRPRTQL